MSRIGTEKAAGDAGTMGGLRHLPNQLTIARLVLSIVFFVGLALHGYGLFGAEGHTTALNVLLAVFVLAVSTDFLDGWIARRWGLVSTFGRIADPFVDKVIICGSFIMLTEVSGLVRAWYAVVILIREFLVSGLRSFLESRGVAFGALMSGKIKMLLQSITVPFVLLHEANFSAPATSPLRDVTWLREVSFWTTVGLLALTLVATLASCVGYVRKAALSLREA